MVFLVSNPWQTAIDGQQLVVYSIVRCLMRPTNTTAECIYLGNDWLLFATTAATHEFAQMIAPCLILSPVGQPLTFETNTAHRITGTCLAHGVETTSRGIGALATFLYFDPLSNTGRHLESFVTNTGIIMPPVDLPAVEEGFLFALTTGDLSASSVSDWVNKLVTSMDTGLSDCSDLDTRILLVADQLKQKTEGRPELANLAKLVHLSPDSLRRLFAQQTGMTLSRYQMWQRIRQMVAHACAVYANGSHPSMEEMIFAAGFYDTPHAAKSFHRFFAKRASAITMPTGFLSCP